MRALFFQHRHHTRNAKKYDWLGLLLALVAIILWSAKQKSIKTVKNTIFICVFLRGGFKRHTLHYTEKKNTIHNESQHFSVPFSLHRYRDVVQHYMHFFNLYLTVVFGWYMVGRPPVTRCLWLIYFTDKGKHVKRNKRRNMQQVAAREFMLKT